MEKRDLNARTLRRLFYDKYICERCDFCGKRFNYYPDIFVIVATDQYICKKCVVENNLILGKDVSKCFYVE